MGEFVRVASVTDLDDDGTMLVEVGDEQVLLAKVGGELYAIGEECTHEGCSLSDATLDGNELECICHGSTFNVETGEVLQGPAEEPIPTYPVFVEGETVSAEVE